MSDLWAALAIVLIIEGIMPFANPAGWRKMIISVVQLPDKQLRIAGLSAMLIGLLLLQWVRA